MSFDGGIGRSQSDTLDFSFSCSSLHFGSASISRALGLGNCSFRVDSGHVEGEGLGQGPKVQCGHRSKGSALAAWRGHGRRLWPSPAGGWMDLASAASSGAHGQGRRQKQRPRQPRFREWSGGSTLGTITTQMWCLKLLTGSPRRAEMWPNGAQALPCPGSAEENRPGRWLGAPCRAQAVALCTLTPDSPAPGPSPSPGCRRKHLA